MTSHKRSRRFGEPFAIAAIFLAVSAASPAWAYLDPGTGSMMLQLLLGGAAGAIVVAKLYFRRATEFVRNLGRRRRAD